MDFSSLNFEDTHDVFKTGYQLGSTQTQATQVYSQEQQQQQQQQQQHHDHHHVDTTIDFFAFTDASTDFNNVSAAPIGTSSSSQQPHHQQQQHIDYTNIPQLTPDAGKFTSSSVLSGTNPEYMMSPLQISTHANAGVNPQPYPLDDLTGFGDDEVYICNNINNYNSIIFIYL